MSEQILPTVCLLIHTCETFRTPRRCRTGDAVLCEFCASLPVRATMSIEAYAKAYPNN